MKVLCSGSSPATSSVFYRECVLTEDVSSMLVPLQDKVLNVEIVSTEHSIYAPDYYTKIDIYAYSRDGDVFFSQAPLALQTDKVVVSCTFFRKLREYLSTYLSDELCKLSGRWFKSGKKCFFLAEFYFKHGFFDKAHSFARKALRDERLGSFEKAVLLENELWMHLFGQKGVKRPRLTTIVELYRPESGNIIRLITDMGRYVDVSEFMFLTRLVDPRKLKYLERIHFFYACAQIFSSRQRRHGAVFNYVNAYFSVQDGYNVDFKRHLRHEALALVGGNWRPVMESVLDTIGRNEAEEMQIWMEKDCLSLKSHQARYTDADHSKHFIISVSSFDNIVSFKRHDLFYARNDIFGDETVYYIDYVRLEIVVKEEDVDLLYVCGYALNKNQNILRDQRRDLGVLKTLKKGDHAVNIRCSGDVVLDHVKFKNGNVNTCSKISQVKLLRVEPKFSYRILSMAHDSFGAFQIKIEVQTGEARRPRVFCVGNEGLIEFGKEGGLISVTVPKQSISYGLVQLLCEVTEEVYKKYIFKQAGEKFLLL